MAYKLEIKKRGRKPAHQTLNRQQALEFLLACEPAIFECLACRLLVDGYCRDIPLYIDVSSTEEALTVCLLEPVSGWPESLNTKINGLNNQDDHFKYHIDRIEDCPYFMTTAVIAWKGRLSFDIFDRWLDALIDAHKAAAACVRHHVAGPT